MSLKKFLLLTVHCLLLTAVAGCTEAVKEPAVAGSFYPADGRALKETVERFLMLADGRPVDGRLIALISPHAGYQFSGHVAAYNYKQLKGKEINTVILLGPSHHKAFNGASVYALGSMKTPLGKIKIDEKIAGALIDEKAGVTFYAEAFEKEHSIEVQLPFLQSVLKDFKIVPVLIGAPTKESFEHLIKKLTETLRGNDKAVIIASTDLSHYHDYITAVKMDSRVIEAIERISLEEVENYLMTGECEMCGSYPVMLVMAVAKGLGANNSVLFKYANSGDVTGDKDRVVGYAAIGLYVSPLTRDEKTFLLSLAKNTISDYVTRGVIPDIVMKNPKLTANAATFVTINRNGDLRGCIGNIRPVMPLYKSVIMNAVAASSKDHRFQPMGREELGDMEVEVTILSPLEPLKDIKDIEIGKHGLYLIKGENNSVFLPQVPKEFGWDLNTYLEKLSLKAGLTKDAWMDAQLFTFQGEIIK